MTDKIEVTDADIELLAVLHDILGNCPAAFTLRKVGPTGKILSEQAEAIAAHRIAGERAGMERAAGIAEEVSSRWKADFVNHNGDELLEAGMFATRDTATAIRAQAGEAS